MRDGRVQAMPGEEEVWLVGERRTSGEQKYYLSNLPADTPLKTLAAVISQAILDLFARPPPRRCPHCEKLIADPIQQNLPK